MIDDRIAALERGELLTEKESTIFSLVIQTCTSVQPPVVARVAGGWVRDKLLGRDSDDIDIAVENITGIAFAERLKEQSADHDAKIAKIQANPAQSKHLETARVCLFSDFWIDICSLRSDSYTNESRIPETVAGTPSEDAFRRDFTINAIFFNLNTQKVEDFTNGIFDLNRGIIRTPLDPTISFQDDPLRVLRAFRFMCRFNFDLADNIIPAARTIVSNFRTKITRERITAEIVKSITGSSPAPFIEKIAESSLFAPIFDPDGLLALNEADALERVSVVASHGVTERPLEFLLSAIYAPFSGRKMSDPERKNRQFPVIEVTLVRKLRFPVQVAATVMALLKSARKLALIERPLVGLQVGRWVRKIGDLWNLVHVVVIDNDVYEFCVNEFYPFIEQNGLGSVWTLKPLLKGMELAELIGIRPGPELKKRTKELIDWQIEHPIGTAEDYRAFVNA
jgi:tRNA nucleotidyltransferase (CCA-adding enzyme)